ncbi:RpiR family transcriptional regulator [Thermosporothrix hazakensis]|jgi:DNA-binding MurR/RpiR family transcriptional regulator|uniref:RpiR family transcriptional regulator n=1 Tax=Thermosporothrix hazakensis TaxID=644383 RepID=A0A326U2W1_THEHA|nr:MurR/RpiR family transcriptional regulator [Thermosporothrix hazakensis]PZW24717.1 RpiR family transcriptional regulator [Thermosporothrix hazakensis]GCE48337.1 RpiR family transcriptional regulator [Thermosporothrix hazakensis]
MEKEYQAIPEGVLARLRTHFSSLSDTEQRVARFIEQHPQDFIHLSVQALAQRIHVSEASIVRCCRSIGYHGIRDLKLALASELAGSLHQIHEDIRPEDSVLTITQKVLQSDMQAIADTLSILDETMLERAVQVLLKASRIEMYGIGASLPIIIDAYYRFLRIGLPATMVTDPHMQAVSAALLPEGSVAFAISHSGRSRQTLMALKKAREAGASTILLSSHANTPLGEYADIQLITTARETAFRREALTSRIAHLSVIDALYVAIAMQRPDSSLRLLKQVSDILDETALL